MEVEVEMHCNRYTEFDRVRDKIYLGEDALKS